LGKKNLQKATNDQLMSEAIEEVEFLHVSDGGDEANMTTVVKNQELKIMMTLLFRLQTTEEKLFQNRTNPSTNV
jgi:hypothetical protein